MSRFRTRDDEQMEGLLLDIDLRLLAAWKTLGEAPELPFLEDGSEALKIFTQAIRLAYERGYVDALREDNRGDRAKLFLDNQFAPPEGVL